MLKTILVTGSCGHLGLSLKLSAMAWSQYQFIFSNRNDIDFSNSQSIITYFSKRKFDLIINCAAYTAVDMAESEPKLADAINHLAVKQLANIAQAQGSILVHISTDYVFDGTNNKAYVEEDPSNPQNVYGISKLNGEIAIQTIKPQAIIIRTSWIYSEYGNNFVKTIRKLGQKHDNLKVINDQIGNPTYAKDLADAIIKIIHSSQTQQHLADNLVQIYHYSNLGACSWYDFAKTIIRLSGYNCKINPVISKDYSKLAKRPYFSVLNTAKIKQCYGLSIPYWKNSLHKCIQILQQDKAT